MTTSAEIAAFELLRKSGFSGRQLAESRVTPEQARDAIFFLTGVRIPAGLIETELKRVRRETPVVETAGDAASDFKRASLGQYHARMSGRSRAPVTDLYRLIAQRDR